MHFLCVWFFFDTVFIDCRFIEMYGIELTSSKVSLSFIRFATAAA